MIVWNAVVRATAVLAFVAGSACKFDPPADVPGDDEDDIDAGVDAEPEPDAMPNPAMLGTEQGAHDFGDVTTGQTSATLTVVISNTGEQASGAVSVALAGSNPGDFELVAGEDGDDCEATILDPQATCTTRVRFVPTTAGARSATLRVMATPGGTADVQLTGDGLSPGNLVVTAGAALEFGDVEIQSQSASQSVTVQNTGGTATASLTVELSNATDYTKTADTCMGTALAPSATCTVSVRFNPITVGSRGGSISVRESPTVGITASASGRGSARIQVTRTGTGTVTSVPAGVDCGGACTGTFTQTPVTLVASAGGGFAFDGWGGACATAGTNTMCSVSLTTPLTMVSSTFRELACTPSTTVCDDAMGRYVECGPTGEIEVEILCPLGCASGMEKCVDVNPSNGLAAYLSMSDSAPDVSFTTSTTINTTTGEVLVNGTPLALPHFSVAQPTGPSIRVYPVKSLTISGTVKVTGNRALAFVSHGDISITGTLDVSADGPVGGPGRRARDGSNMPIDSVSLESQTGGGGGGGHATAGAPGGAGGAVAGGQGSPIEGNTNLIPLWGGADAGRATENVPLCVSEQGAAGGATQLVSRTRISLTGSGAIDASGGGGRPGAVGCQSPSNGAGGAGGGAGGAVLLEAPVVVLDGSGVVISTKGGGGAAAGIGTSFAGQDGGTSASPATGGQNPTGADGGNGGTATQAPTAGQSASGSADGGGGGGAVGRTRINTASGSYSTSNGAAIRSASSPGTIQTRLVP